MCPRLSRLERLFCWAIAGVLVVVALLSSIARAAADVDADNAKAKAVLHELVQELGYRGPDPEITRVNQHELVEICQCRSSRGGVYRDHSVYLWIGVDLDTLFGKSIVLHELQHHIQFMKHGPVRGCDEWHRREMEAIQKQNEWLSAHGSATHALFVGSCPADKPKGETQ